MGYSIQLEYDLMCNKFFSVYLDGKRVSPEYDSFMGAAGWIAGKIAVAQYRDWLVTGLPDHIVGINEQITGEKQ